VNVTPLARGPVCPREQAVLDAIPTSIGTTAALAHATRLDPEQVERALAQLTRRGLVVRASGRARLTVKPSATRRLRPLPGDPKRPAPTLPAA
jgi:2-methylcitrate dehydratase PrpD